MTLIIAAVNETVAVIASDRRFTSGSTIVDEEATKATIITCADARCALAFTGLATAPSFSTQGMILDALQKSGQNGIGIDQILATFSDLISARVSGLKVPRKAERRIHIVICGFKYADDGKSMPFIYRLTNADSKGNILDRFEMTECHGGQDGTFIEIDGYLPAIPEDHLETFQNIVSDPGNSEAIRAKAYDLIRRSSDNPKSRGTIGKQCNCTVIRADTSRNIESTYFSAISSRVVYGADSAMFVAEKPQMVFGAELHVGDESPFAVVPKSPRNSPCPCGTGLKYKRCHRRFKYRYLPLRAEIKFTDGKRLPAGSEFVVESRGAAAT